MCRTQLLQLPSPHFHVDIKVTATGPSTISMSVCIDTSVVTKSYPKPDSGTRDELKLGGPLSARTIITQTIVSQDSWQDISFEKFSQIQGRRAARQKRGGGSCAAAGYEDDEHIFTSIIEVGIWTGPRGKLEFAVQHSAAYRSWDSE